MIAAKSTQVSTSQILAFLDLQDSGLQHCFDLFSASSYQGAERVRFEIRYSLQLLSAEMIDMVADQNTQ